MKKENLEYLEKYSIWIKINSALMGPSLIISLVYILFYILVIVLLLLKPELIQPYIIYYYVGFPFFIIAIWLVFTSGLLRSTKQKEV